MIEAMLVWMQFGICAGLILVAGTQLSRYGDIIAEKKGLSGSWVGLIMLATVSSLPELVAGVSSVTVANAPDIGVGGIFGSCVFNLAILVVLDFLLPDESIYHRASQGHILSAGFGILLIGFAAFCILLGARFPEFLPGGVGLYTPIIALLYFIAIRSVFFYEQSNVQEFVEKTEEQFADVSLKQAVKRYLIASAVVVAAGIWLPFVGKQLSALMGWDDSFVGTLFIAGVTSLPEFAITISALRIGAVDMAVANLLGSNLFNIFMLSIEDLFYAKGPVLLHVSQNHVVSALSAMMMSGIVVIGLLYRSNSRLFKVVDWVSMALLVLYVLNFTMIYLHG